MSHPFHDWTGKSNKLNSAIICLPNKDSISQVAVSVNISSFDSENSNRDSHVIEVTEAVAETVGVAAVARGRVVTPISAATAIAEIYRSFMALPTLILVSSVSG